MGTADLVANTLTVQSRLSMRATAHTPIVDAVPVDAGKLLDVLIRDLDLPDDIGSLRRLVRFDGGYPFLPLPHKSVEYLLGHSSINYLNVRHI